MSCVKNLGDPDPSKWIAAGCPLPAMMGIERRHGKDKPVITKALVKLGGFKATHDELSFIDQVLAVAGDVDRDGRLSLNEINGMLSSRRASSLRIAEAPAPISG